MTRQNLGRKSGLSISPHINGNITIPKTNTYDSLFAGSHSNQSSISESRLEPSPPITDAPGTVQPNTSFAEQQDNSKTINRAGCQKEQIAQHHQVQRLGLREGVLVMTRDAGGAALRGIRRIHPPTLLLTALLSFGVWYTFPFNIPKAFKIR
jgi:hypothetical protein